MTTDPSLVNDVRRRTVLRAATVDRTHFSAFIPKVPHKAFRPSRRPARRVHIA
ncbi:hypothetical protein [Streptomyces formicae]